MKKLLLIISCFIFCTSLYNCHKTIQTTNLKESNNTISTTKPKESNNTNHIAINSIPEDNLTLSYIIYPNKKSDIITGVDILSIPEDVKVDLIDSKWLLLRTNFNNLGLNEKLTFIVNNNELVTKNFSFMENNYLDTIVILQAIGLPMPEKSQEPKLKEIFFSNKKTLFGENSIRLIIKDNINLTPSKEAPPYYPYSGSIELPSNKIPQKIILEEELFEKCNIIFIYIKNSLVFTANESHRRKILVFFQDGETLIYTIEIEGGMGKG
jgi:hypothetical protein